MSMYDNNMWKYTFLCLCFIYVSTILHDICREPNRTNMILIKMQVVPKLSEVEKKTLYPKWRCLVRVVLVRANDNSPCFCFKEPSGTLHARCGSVITSFGSAAGTAMRSWNHLLSATPWSGKKRSVQLYLAPLADLLQCWIVMFKFSLGRTILLFQLNSVQFFSEQFIHSHIPKSCANQRQIYRNLHHQVCPLEKNKLITMLHGCCEQVPRKRHIWPSGYVLKIYNQLRFILNQPNILLPCLKKQLPLRVLASPRFCPQLRQTRLSLHILNILGLPSCKCLPFFYPFLVSKRIFFESMPTSWASDHGLVTSSQQDPPSTES